MIDKISQQNPYNAVNDAYNAFNMSFKVRGTLIEKNETDVKIDIGDNKILEAKLKENIDADVGDVVVIDKKNIIKSKTISAENEIKVEKDEEAVFSDILKRLEIDINDENLNAAKKLQSHGVQITKENIQSYVFSKTCLDEIIGSLDYDSAVKLLDKDIDIENDSLQKIAAALDDIKNEKEGFSFAKLFKMKKEISTKEAEEISIKLYGSSMGKDITDIIKTLYKRDVSITKKNIEKVDDIFHKLDKLQDIEDKTFIDTVKNNIDVNIDNLYKIKNFIKKGAVEAFDKISSISTRMYENFLPKTSKISEKDLRLLEEDIKSLLDDMDMKISDENIKLAKEFIKNNLDITKENIQNISDMKTALKEVIKNLDYDKASILIKSGIDIEKIDIRELAKQIEEIKNMDNEIKNMKIEEKNLVVEDKDVKEILEKVDKFKNINDKDLLTLLKKNVDFKIEKVDQVVFKSKEGNVIEDIKNLNYKMPEYNLNLTKKSLQNIDEINEKDRTSIVENDMNFKITTIEENMKNMMNENSNDELLNNTVNTIDKLSQVFNNLKNLNFNTIAFQIRNKIPMTLKSLEYSHLLLNNKQVNTSNFKNVDIVMPKKITSENENVIKKYVDQNLDIFEAKREDQKTIVRAVEAAKSLIQNSLNLSKLNIQRVYEAYGNFKNIKDNLSSNMVLDSVQKNMNLEDMNLNDLSNHVNSFKENIAKQNVNKPSINEYLKTFTNNITNISSERESSLALLMKNNKPLSLKEIQKNSFLLKNKDQLGHKISSVVEFLEIHEDESLKESAVNLKRVSRSISKNLKEGNINPKEAYEDINNTLKDIKNNVRFTDEETNKSFNKKFKELSEALELSYVLNKQEKIIQMPLYMNEQFTNLNMYFRDKKNGNKKIDSEDMDIVLSLDTANMGNLNIHLEVDKNKVSLKMAVNDPSDKEFVSKYKDVLQNLLQNIGYELDDISFDTDKDKNIMNMNQSTDKIHVNTGFFDFKI